MLSKRNTASRQAAGPKHWPGADLARVCRFAGTALLAALLTVFLHAAPPQDDNHRVKSRSGDSSLKVHVVNGDGAIVAGAEVQLIFTEKWSERTAKTNKAGQAEFTGVRPGRYEVVVAAHGYQTFRKVVIVNQAENLDVDAKIVHGSLTLRRSQPRQSTS